MFTAVVRGLALVILFQETGCSSTIFNITSILVNTHSIYGEIKIRWRVWVLNIPFSLETWSRERERERLMIVIFFKSVSRRFEQTTPAVNGTPRPILPSQKAWLEMASDNHSLISYKSAKFIPYSSTVKWIIQRGKGKIKLCVAWLMLNKYSEKWDSDSRVATKLVFFYFQEKTLLQRICELNYRV